jgi:hypothetical protein
VAPIFSVDARAASPFRKEKISLSPSRAMKTPLITLLTVLALAGSGPLCAHPGHEHDTEQGSAAGKSANPSTRKPTRVSFAAEERATGHVKITEREGYRYVEADGLPNHETGRFPNRGNPNTIRAQAYDFRVPLVSKLVAGPRPFVGGWVFGVALNGVPFDPLTAEFFRGDRRSPWRYEAISPTVSLGLDQNLAHVQPSGAYHYHGLPAGLVAVESKKDGTLNRQPESKSDPKQATESQLVLLGYAADGYPIYTPFGRKSAGNELKRLKSSYRLKTGARPAGALDPGGNYDGTFTLDFEYVAGSGDLDESNGFTGPTPQYPNGTYYYALTEEFPFIPRSFRGEPDPSFQHAAARAGAGGPPLGSPRGPPFPPPPGRRPLRPPPF